MSSIFKEFILAIINCWLLHSMKSLIILGKSLENVFGHANMSHCGEFLINSFI